MCVFWEPLLDNNVRFLICVMLCYVLCPHCVHLVCIYIYYHKTVAKLLFCHATGGKLPFEDASVGAVLAVIKNVESLREQLVAEISRVLKAGGRVLVQSPAPSSSQKVLTYQNLFLSLHFSCTVDVKFLIFL
jgi:SAM-dependent methyltransferase